MPNSRLGQLVRYRDDSRCITVYVARSYAVLLMVEGICDTRCRPPAYWRFDQNSLLGRSVVNR